MYPSAWFLQAQPTIRVKAEFWFKWLITSWDFQLCRRGSTWDAGRWVGAPEGYKWQGHVWAHAVVERPWLAMLFHLVSPPFPGFNDRFSASPEMAFLESLDWKFVNWWVWLQSCICLGWLQLQLWAVSNPIARNWDESAVRGKGLT